MKINNQIVMLYVFFAIIKIELTEVSNYLMNFKKKNSFYPRCIVYGFNIDLLFLSLSSKDVPCRRKVKRILSLLEMILNFLKAIRR